jgi:hypothetical protein
MNNKGLVLFLMGGVMGCAAMYLYMTRKHEEGLLDLEDIRMGTSEDVESERRPYESPECKDEETSIPVPEKILVMRDQTYKKIVTKYNKGSDVIMSKHVVNKPHVIDIEEFSEGMPEYDKCTIWWYQGDGILADENEEIIENLEPVIGSVNLVAGNTEGDNNVIYVRNDSLEIDYEVICTNDNYSDRYRS